MTDESGKRRPGRPGDADPETTRERILDEARRLFATRGYGDVGLREIAAAAGVTAATIHHHFGTKEGLYRRVLSDAADVLLERVRAAAAGHELSTEERLRQVVQAYGEVLGAHPYLPRLVFRQLMSHDERFGEWFREEYARKAGTMVPQIVLEGMHSGELRPLDVRFTVISLLSLCVFFHLGFPMFSQVLGLDSRVALDGLPAPTSELIGRYTDHVLELFLRGVAVRQDGKEDES